jgi:hypothetical protein
VEEIPRLIALMDENIPQFMASIPIKGSVLGSQRRRLGYWWGKMLVWKTYQP